MFKEALKRNKGITLIALVVTIIVLLILAGISISMLTGQNGILNRAQEAKESTQKAQDDEQTAINNTSKVIDSYVSGKGYDIVEPTNIEDWDFTTEDDGTLTITGYKGSDTEVVIPNYIGGVKVKRIESSNVDSIWDNDISDEIDNLQVGYRDYISRQKTIKKITISYGIEEIGNYAFCATNGLENISIPSSVTNIKKAAFEECSRLTNITIPSSTTSIGEYAFSSCFSLANITIPSSVTSIGIGALQDCSSLTNITIPSGVTSIGESTFKRCSSLTNITIPSGVTYIGSWAFERCTGLTNITIPSSVTNIEYGAFNECSSLNSITIPSSVTTMSNYIFSGIPSITVTVPYKSGENPPSGWASNWNGTSSDCEIKIKYQE